MQKTYDYGVLYKAFSHLIADKCQLTMIELNGNGKQPPAPFVAFDIISPYIPNNFLEDDSTKAFEAVVSFTVYAQSKIQALNVANQMRQMFGDSLNQIKLAEDNIVIVERMPTQIRSTNEATQTSFLSGFDMRLRLQAPYESEIEEINNINIKENYDE